MPTEVSAYRFLVVFLVAAIAFPLVPILLAKVWARLYSPPKPGAEKQATYECGLVSKGDVWVQFHSNYYLYGILFLVFDVEVVFLLPFAVAFLKLPLGAALAMLVFLLLLAEGLVWAWKKGVLKWR